MARIVYGSLDDSTRGPFPHKAGEFCGNFFLEELDSPKYGDIITINNPEEALPNLRLGNKAAKFRVSKPVTTIGFYWADGALYLAQDMDLNEDEEEIKTDMFLEEVVSGKRPAAKPINFGKIRRREL